MGFFEKYNHCVIIIIIIFANLHFPSKSRAGFLQFLLGKGRNGSDVGGGGTERKRCPRIERVRSGK